MNAEQFPSEFANWNHSTPNDDGGKGASLVNGKGKLVNGKGKALSYETKGREKSSYNASGKGKAISPLAMAGYRISGLDPKSSNRGGGIRKPMKIN